MKSESLKQVLIKPNIPLKNALKQMDKFGKQILVVVDKKNKLQGIVTDGNIRRAILKGADFESPIRSFMTQNPISISFPVDKNEALKTMKKHTIRHIPVVDEENRVRDLLLWIDFLNEGEIIYPAKKTPVIIMAGGKGLRLDPFTKILPKPLIPLGEKPIIEIIMHNFKKYGFHQFHISVNYRAEMIKLYFAENPSDYQIDYIEEKKFLGTAGSLFFVKNKLMDTFIISNCDIIIDADFDNFLSFHKKNKNHISVLAINRRMNIPYGILKMKKGDFETIEEKPEYHFIVNSGVYALESEILDLIPKDQPVDMPHLMLAAKQKGYKVQVYPISCSWFDVGEWDEYKKALKYIETRSD